MNDGIRFEPEDLDGHTFEELVEYLDAERTPRDESIEASAGCRLALDALTRLRALAPDLLHADILEEEEAEESWVQGVLGSIALDVRSGRRIPFRTEIDGDALAITEGAVRGVIRAAENAIPGMIVGRTHLHGDVTVVGEPIRVELDAAVPWGSSIDEMVQRIRDEVARRLQQHTDLNVAAIDVVVRDVHLPSAPARSGGGEGL